MVEDLLRRTNLLDEAVLHNDDPVAQGHSLSLVVGDVNKGCINPFAEFDDLSTHLVPELSVQVGQRLVHQEDLRVPNDGAADGHTLALTAGQSLGLPTKILGDVQNLRSLLDLLVDLVLGNLAELQGKSHVFIHGHMGIQGVVLENHGNIPVLGSHVVDQTVANV